MFSQDKALILQKEVYKLDRVGIAHALVFETYFQDLPKKQNLQKWKDIRKKFFVEEGFPMRTGARGLQKALALGRNPLEYWRLHDYASLQPKVSKRSLRNYIQDKYVSKYFCVRTLVLVLIG